MAERIRLAQPIGRYSSARRSLRDVPVTFSENTFRTRVGETLSLEVEVLELLLTRVSDDTHVLVLAVSLGSGVSAAWRRLIIDELV